MKVIGKHKTKVYTIDGITRVKYHSTDIIEFNQVYIKLNSNGWQTATTKTRMNQAASQFNLNFNVYQKDFTWYISYFGHEIEYYDNIVLDRLNKSKHEFSNN